jgi:hypothetical protein
LSYIGRKPTIGNFQICDAISVVNGQAAYTMQVGGVNVSPQSSNHMIVSLNGTIQKPGGANPSFTVSGSTITFASNLATGDVIDFIQILGDVLDLGVPSDATVTAAKIGANAVTAAKLNNDIISGSTELASEPADTDEFLVSDAGTLKRIDYSHIKASPGLIKISRTDISSSPSTVAFNGVFSSTYRNYFIIGSGINFASNSVQLRSRLGVGTAYETGGYLSTVVSGSYAYNGSNSGGSNYQSTGNFILNEFTVTANQNDLSFFAYVFIPNIANMNTSFSGRSVAMQQDSGYMIGSSFQGQLVNNAQITDINFFPSSGNFGNTGEITVFGIKES